MNYESTPAVHKQSNLCNVSSNIRVTDFLKIDYTPWNKQCHPFIFRIALSKIDRYAELLVSVSLRIFVTTQL